MRIEITYRFPNDPRRHTDIIDEADLEGEKAKMAEFGGNVTSTREVHWSEELATMENNPDCI